ncbi:hypothetical protein K443DRAFT_133079 [Laccaria amethystina LaAM-08-1]|uniref:TRUD domain-containing protein n=1 Tax=Laccaria amethystina LaAM-08-1 TaxID=1095629 RepID=A0A0C9XTW4_9AGAR|nr:hypothetical protein K443DRAFT_133079 [Laccaria amethystina LaAM-08-1]
MNFLESNVGISEYVGHGTSKVEGIIKQRFTDFLVYEVDLDGKTLRIKSLDKPETPNKSEPTGERSATTDPSSKGAEARLEESETMENSIPWPEHFTAELSPFLSEGAILQIKQMYLEGPEPPRVSDSGWGVYPFIQPITSKVTRTALHKAIRELFHGKLDSETDSTGPASDEGSRIVIKWGRKGSGRGGNGRGVEPGVYPPYIHFTLQKTNRDTQDALGHLSRLLHVSIKDLSVAGTKDKRGVTVQRVSLKRNNKTVEDVWKLANGIDSRKPAREVLTKRGDRGVRIADLNYRKASLELGMLKGNAFVITLRCVGIPDCSILHLQSEEALNQALDTMKNKGFINYYGMQRFGTASIPTHSIGLALLKSEWQKAVSMILQKRHGEHPDVAAARDAWLVDGDLDTALRLLPKRVVAERCLLESFKKQGGDTRNAMGALSTIPRNLRLMYVHAYQSYVWNAIVSERVKGYGADKPVIGDLVFDKEGDTEQTVDVGLQDDTPLFDGIPEGEGDEPDDASRHKKSRKPYVPPRIKTLTESDLDKYTIFDVIMPLPGTDVAYPGGKLGERYKEFLRMDGLDPDNFVRKQREYTLNGSYRAIIHLPRELSWSVLRYTDPDVPLAQSDEDKLLGFDPPSIVDDGKFMALQIELTLGTAAYATMALREITKTDTSSHIQTSLTHASEDQKYP